MTISYAVQTILRQLVASGFPIALIFAMSRFKYSRKTVWLFFAVIAVIGTVVNSAHFHHGSRSDEKGLCPGAAGSQSVIFAACHQG